MIKSMTADYFALTMHAKKWIIPQNTSFLIVLPAIRCSDKLESLGEFG
jgi:hypothetical protein